MMYEICLMFFILFLFMSFASFVSVRLTSKKARKNKEGYIIKERDIKVLVESYKELNAEEMKEHRLMLVGYTLFFSVPSLIICWILILLGVENSRNVMLSILSVLLFIVVLVVTFKKSRESKQLFNEELEKVEFHPKKEWRDYGEYVKSVPLNYKLWNEYNQIKRKIERLELEIYKILIEKKELSKSQDKIDKNMLKRIERNKTDLVDTKLNLKDLNIELERMDEAIIRNITNEIPEEYHHILNSMS